MPIGVYEIKHLASGKCYIGSSVDIEKRLKRHLLELNRGTHDSAHLQYAWTKYGAQAFSCSILEVTSSVVEARDAEQAWLDRYWPAVYNKAQFIGRHSLGIKWTDERRAAFSAKMQGHATSEATKEKIRAAQKGRPVPKERIAKMRLSKIGSKASDETRAKMSAAHQGVKQGPRSDAFKAYCSVRSKGKRLTAEHRKKISLGLTGTKKPASFIEALRARNIGNTYAKGLKRSHSSFPLIDVMDRKEESA